MAFIQVSIGSGASVGISSNADNFSINTLETTGEFLIPAGAIWAIIQNAGFVKDGDDNVDATILGEPWVPGRKEKFESFVDPSTGKTMKLPAIAGNGNGARVFITYATI